MHFFTVLNYFPFQVRERERASTNFDFCCLRKLLRSASHLYGRVKTSLKGGKDGRSFVRSLDGAKG